MLSSPFAMSVSTLPRWKNLFHYGIVCIENITEIGYVINGVRRIEFIGLSKISTRIDELLAFIEFK